MDSDDSAASEVESEADAYEESFVADSIEEEDAVKPSRTAISSRPSPGPVLSSRTAAGDIIDEAASNPYADDDYEADEDAYSVDFEDADEPKQLESRVGSVPSPGRGVGVPRPIAEDAEYEYSAASFEEESRVSQSQSTRLVVDLSVPVRRDSKGSSGGGSPVAKASLNPNSPHVNLKVLSKPSPIQAPVTWTAPPPAPLVPHPAVVAMLEQESDKSLSLLLRKVESKYQDELEELREKNALLTWKERELKTELRIHKEELKMRKSRIEKKRKRAMERRKEAETLVERLEEELKEMEAKLASAEARYQSQIAANEGLRMTVEQGESERRAVEARNLALAERLQATLSDFHALNLKYEDAVRAKVDAERRGEEQAAKHRMECEVLEHKAQIDVDAVLKTLEREREDRAKERATLPEAYRTMVENERQRLEAMEGQLKAKMTEMETHVAKESVRFEKELALAHEAKRAAEERAEKRLQEELNKIARERDALDEQRRELLVSMTKSAARVDEERSRLDATREQLEVRRLKLVEERAELDTRGAYVEDRVHRLVQEESVLEARKAELTKLGRETYEKTRVLAQRMQAFTEMKSELERLRAAQQELMAKMQESEERAQQLEMEKAVVEKTARQLQHERLLVAKQRMQSRQFLDGAKKLELLLQQQKALEQVARSGGTTSS